MAVNKCLLCNSDNLILQGEYLICQECGSRYPAGELSITKCLACHSTNVRAEGEFIICNDCGCQFSKNGVYVAKREIEREDHKTLPILAIVFSILSPLIGIILSAICLKNKWHAKSALVSLVTSCFTFIVWLAFIIAMAELYPDYALYIVMVSLILPL